jgi:hypothetical protein
MFYLFFLHDLHELTMWKYVGAPTLRCDVTQARASNNLGISPRFLTSQPYAMARFRPLPKDLGFEYDKIEHDLFPNQAQLYPHATILLYCPCTGTALYSARSTVDFSIYNHEF